MTRPFIKNYLVALFAALTVLAVSCKKDKTIETTPIATGGSATVTAGGYGFDGGNAGKFSSTKAGITQTTAGGVTSFSLTAIKDGGNESITIVLLKAAAVGKVQVGPSLSNGGVVLSKDYTKAGDAALNYSTDYSGPNMAGGAEINFTKVDGKNVEGTFYVVAFNNARKEAYAEQGAFKGTIN